MAKGSAKKPSDPKCRGSAAPIEGRDWVRVGGSKWLRDVAEQKGKFIALEHRAGFKKAKAAAAAAEEAPEEASADEVAEVTAAAE